jgi:hypothetical protein
VQLCDQIKVAVNKYFSALESLQDVASKLLNDFKTPQSEYVA